jgi:hypothetical protein
LSDADDSSDSVREAESDSEALVDPGEEEHIILPNKQLEERRKRYEEADETLKSMIAAFSGLQIHLLGV